MRCSWWQQVGVLWVVLGACADRPVVDGAGEDAGDTGPRYDLGREDLPHCSGGGQRGCSKVDFLFVIDNSSSMRTEQEALVNSFPGFIDEIRAQLGSSDYHILVTDTDPWAEDECNIGNYSGEYCELSCKVCQARGCPSCTCEHEPCPAIELDACDNIMGAGKTRDTVGTACGFDSGRRYMAAAQRDLSETFSCAALVGVEGSGYERPMEAMMEAVTTQAGADACNAGFLRHDAILVVVVITDEDDPGRSPGDPDTWRDVLVSVKHGDPEAIVPLALAGEYRPYNGDCESHDPDEWAEMRLRAWAESFPHGRWAPTCGNDYTPFFREAVALVEASCDEFEEPCTDG